MRGDLRGLAHRLVRTLLTPARRLLPLCLAACWGSPPPGRDGVPDTLARVRALHDPPRIEVEEGEPEQARPLAPALHWGGPPPRLDPSIGDRRQVRVTVRRDGVPWIDGFWLGDGRLRAMDQLEGGSIHRFQRITLPTLGEEAVVETDRAPAPVGEDEAAFSPVLVLPQVDLLTPTREALTPDASAERRAALLIEAWEALEREAAPLLEERLADPAEPEATRTKVLATLCAESVWTHVPEGLDGVIAASARAPTPAVADAALTCASRLLAGEPLERLGEAVVDGVCDGTLDPWPSSGRLRAIATPTLADRADRCAAPARRALLLRSLGRSLDPMLWQEALDDPGPALEGLLRTLDPNRPADRGALLATLASQPDPITPLRLALDAGEPTDALALTALVDLWIAPPGDPLLFRGELIRGLPRGACLPEAGALERLATMPAGAARSLAEVLSGRHDQAPALARHLDPTPRVRRLRMVPTSEADLVAWGLVGAGCDPDALASLATGGSGWWEAHCPPCPSPGESP